MPCVEWGKQFTVGISQIDEEHKMLIGLINEAFDSAELMDPEANTREVLAHMRNYAIGHFKTEENLMRLYNCEDDGQHVAEHREFLRRVEAAEQRLAAGRILDPFSIFDFLKTWLHEHVLGTDRRLGRCLLDRGLL